MADEQWGTLSIYDHRTPVLRQALLHFDRLVVPLPPTPIYDLTDQELDALHADAEFLERSGGAVIMRWDSDEVVPAQ